MAIVNIDLSEYDAIRNRNKELEKQVEKLEKDLDVLKNNSKVIVREVAFKRIYHRCDEDFPVEKDIKEIISESYVNFEDVRLKVENEMKDEIANSTNGKYEAIKRYDKERAELEADYKKKEEKRRASIAKELSLAKENAKELDALVDNLQGKLSDARTLANEAVDILEARFFKPTHAISILKELLNRTNV